MSSKMIIEGTQSHSKAENLLLTHRKYEEDKAIRPKKKIQPNIPSSPIINIKGKQMCSQFMTSFPEEISLHEPHHIHYVFFKKKDLLIEKEIPHVEIFVDNLIYFLKSLGLKQKKNEQSQKNV